MKAIGYDCLGTRLFEVHAKSKKGLDKKIDIYWSQEVASVSCYDDDGDLLKVIYPLEV